MESILTTSSLALFALGAFHGVNPGMGWLFAVARGMQEGRRAEVWRALLPMGAGHALAVAAAVAVAMALGDALPVAALRWAVAAILIALGARRLVRHRHPRLGGMRVGMRGIAAWSFLMASAHGAGLMVVPVLLGGDAAPAHAALVAAPATQGAGLGGLEAALAATAIHAVGYLVVSALAAAVVYEKLGLRFLRTGWWNLDLVWAVALIATGAITLLV
ncbi:MAG TPA: hypothetical protein VFS53_05125 [Gemmatimonadota bacterium]|nr:hypothetical protein [Gemmatimonadota bacterium]